ncbi:MAG: lytic murein transglycosylase B [Thauera sp.]|nr:lytic murein transglycosylase B [Thauera sp.]
MKKTLRAMLALIAATACAPGSAQASFMERDGAQAFVRELAERHGFDASIVSATLAAAAHEPQVIRLISPPTRAGVRSWQRYRARFLDRLRIDGGLAFWNSHEEDLRRASERYGIPIEIIVAIIGVETVYGRNTGNFETLSALATLAFDYPPRAELFRRELEALFLLAREQGRDPRSYYGSYAGALGYPQFLPSSVRSFGVDFDGDGRINFEAGPSDAIGSVANYLHAHGWQAGAPIAERARFDGVIDPAPLIAAGIEPALEPIVLAQAGVKTLDGSAPPATATLVDLETPGATTEYWLGYRNFYVITRYNRSSFYAMSVFELAEALRVRRSGLIAQQDAGPRRPPGRACATLP